MYGMILEEQINFYAQYSFTVIMNIVTCFQFN